MKLKLLIILIFSFSIGFGQKTNKFYYHEFRSTASTPILTKWNIPDYQKHSEYIIEEVDSLNRVISLTFMKDNEVCQFTGFEASIVNFEYHENKIIETCRYADGTFLNGVEIGIPYKTIYTLDENINIIESEVEYYIDRELYKDLDLTAIENDLKKEEKKLINNIWYYYYSFSKMNKINPVSNDFNENDQRLPYIIIPTIKAQLDTLKKFDKVCANYSLRTTLIPNFNIISVSATSTLTEQLDNSYDSKNTINDNPRNAWIEGESDFGIGQSITFNVTKNVDILWHVHDIILYNGYLKSLKHWSENSRIKKIEVLLNGETSCYLELEDTFIKQRFQLKGGLLINSEKEITLKILEVFEGAKYKDTALSGVSFHYIR